MNNLRVVAQLAILYADDHAGRLPVGGGANPAAHESLQLLADAFADECDPELLVCPASGDRPAARGTDGKMRLAAGNVSYAWRAKPLRLGVKSGGNVIIACDKVIHQQQGGPAGINVLYADGAVEFLNIEELVEGGLDGFLARNELTR